MPDIDTRDRVIRLETKIEHLIDMVEKNSTRIEAMHERHLLQDGAVGFAKHAVEYAKLLGSGSAGAGVLAFLQHWMAAKAA